MQDNSCTPLDPTKIQPRLPSTMSKFNYKYYGPSKENKVDILKGSQIKISSCSKAKPQSHATTSTSMNTVQKSDLNIVIPSKEQILSSYPDIFKGIGRFP